VTGEVIRKKVAAGRVGDQEGGPGADRGWRLALARAANDTIALPLEVTRLSVNRRSLAELLELAPERALIAVLEGPGDGLGIITLSPPVLSAMIEMQTMGKVGSAAPPSRKPTRTDASMVAGLIDRALEDLEAGLEYDPDLTWAGGFRYASFLDDPRPLGLLLEEEHYRVLDAEVRLGNGAKSGPVLLALPAEGRGRAPRPAPETMPAPVAAALFTKALSDQVMRTEADLSAVLHRVTVPLASVMSLKVGDLVPLSMAALDRAGRAGRAAACRRSSGPEPGHARRAPDTGSRRRNGAASGAWARAAGGGGVGGRCPGPDPGPSPRGADALGEAVDLGPHAFKLVAEAGGDGDQLVRGAQAGMGQRPDHRTAVARGAIGQHRAGGRGNGTGLRLDIRLGQHAADHRVGDKGQARRLGRAAHGSVCQSGGISASGRLSITVVKPAAAIAGRSPGSIWGETA
jgi:flagellar motor switch protein FliM